MNWKMKIAKTTVLSASIFGFAGLTTGAFAADVQIPKHDGKPADMSKPVQVYILMGQSNMTGMGKKDTLEKAVKEKKKYPYLVDADGKWTVRSDVRFIRVSPDPKKAMLNNEWLGATLGTRAPDFDTIGVEYGLGHVIGNAVDAPVMILKSCIGNRSLGWHLLPPGSTRYEVGDKVYAGYREAPASWSKGTEPPPFVVNEGVVTLKGDKPAGWYGGKEYDDDTRNAKKVLAELDKYYPGAKGYEVAGFIWWQGEKDAGTPAYAERYETNLVQLIKSLRKDFNAPNAKFVCATMGEAVKGKTGNNTAKIMEAQLAVSDPAKHPEFKGAVATVYTHDMAQGGSGNGHYGGNAEVYMDVGEAMGQAMIELLKNK
jgi:hypothetical protein